MGKSLRDLWQEYVEEPVKEAWTEHIEPAVETFVVKPAQETLQHIDQFGQFVSPQYKMLANGRRTLGINNLPIYGKNPDDESLQSNLEAGADTLLFAMNFVPGVGWIDDIAKFGKNAGNFMKVTKRARQYNKAAKTAKIENETLEKATLLDGISGYQKHAADQGYKAVPWHDIYDSAIKNPDVADAFRQWALNKENLKKIAENRKIIELARDYASSTREFRLKALKAATDNAINTFGNFAWSPWAFKARDVTGSGDPASTEKTPDGETNGE